MNDENTETQIVHVDSAAMMAITKSEVESQLDAAHKYPRSIKKFLEEAKGMVTLSTTIAKSCIYALPRGGKVIPGPSVRLAEISASAYGNMHVGARVVGVEDRVVVAQGVSWDLEKNLRATLEVRRRITNASGGRFNDDMITMTGNAAASIALRNAIFRTIPRAYIDKLYGDARAVSVGDAASLAHTRQELFQDLVKAGVSPERILARIGRAGLVEVTLEDVEILVGLQSALGTGDHSIDELFPVVEGMGSSSSAKSMEAALKAKAAGGQTAPAPAGAAAPTAPPAVPPPSPVDAPPATQAPGPVAPTAPAAPRRGRPPKAQGAPPAASQEAPAPSAPAPAAAGGPPCLICGNPVPPDKAAWVPKANGWRHHNCAPPAEAPPAAPARATLPETSEGVSCSVCGKPCGADGVSTTSNGKPGYRHPTCPPFGEADPEPPADVPLAADDVPNERQPGEEG
jgi:hypothetical protein